MFVGTVFLIACVGFCRSDCPNIRLLNPDAYWNFDDSASSPVAANVGAYSAIQIGSPIASIGHFGGGRTLDGLSGYAVPGLDALFRNAAEVTVCGWIRPDNVADDDAIFTLGASRQTNRRIQR